MYIIIIKYEWTSDQKKKVILTIVINTVPYPRNTGGTYRPTIKTVQLLKRNHTGEISAYLVWSQPFRAIPVISTENRYDPCYIIGLGIQSPNPTNAQQHIRPILQVGHWSCFIGNCSQPPTLLAFIELHSRTAFHAAMWDKFPVFAFPCCNENSPCPTSSKKKSSKLYKIHMQGYQRQWSTRPWWLRIGRKSSWF